MAKKDTRPTITLKGDQFDKEFRSLINEAADNEGITQSEWVYQSLKKAASLSIEKSAHKKSLLDGFVSTITRGFPRKGDETKNSVDLLDPPIDTAEDRERRRVEAKKEFESLGITVDPYGEGTVLLNGIYIVSLLGRRWRIAGKNKWYWYRTPEQLACDYILNDKRFG